MFKVRSKRFRGDTRIIFFIQRMFEVQKALRGWMLDSETLITFEKSRDKHLNCQCMEDYRLLVGKWDK